MENKETGIKVHKEGSRGKGRKEKVGKKEGVGKGERRWEDEKEGEKG